MPHRQLPSIAFLLVFLMIDCVACGSIPSQTGTGNNPTVTPTLAPSLTPVTSTTPPAASPTASPNCSDLSPMTNVLHSKQEKVNFSMSITPNTVIKGSISGYALNTYPSITGSGYSVGPNNDPIQIQVDQGSKFDEVVIDDMTQGKKTTYTAYNCSFKTSSDILFTGVEPVTFSLDFLLTP